MSTLTFLGAVGEVTGSRYLLEVDGDKGPHRLLLECGLRQGGADADRASEKPFGGQEKRLVFSGDLGNSSSVLMKEPEKVFDADLVLMESTYGDRDHRPLEETIEKFAGVLEKAHAGQSQLIGWAGAFRNRPRFYLVHGEPETQKIFQTALAESDIEAEIPNYGDCIEL